jgi:hypothetical protein
MKHKINTDYSCVKIDYEFDYKINLITDDNKNIPQNDSINILLLAEPQVISKNKDYFIENKKNYDAILTFNYYVLSKCNNAYFFEHGNCWVKDFLPPNNKTFELSFLVGSKNWTEGHLLRHTVWENQSKITIPKNFFISTNSPYQTTIPGKYLIGSKNELFNSQFHLCIENSTEPGFFSEKLIDCLFTKTIPIYYGCENIENWFNTQSIFRVNSFEEIINVCNSLDETTYNKYIESINENYELCLKFMNYEDRLIKKINDVLNIIKK